MPRKPVIGGDRNLWGQIVNAFLADLDDRIAAEFAKSAANTERLANMPGINVKDFGAKGDGEQSTLNTLQKFEEAANASAGEYKLIVPDGIYNLAGFHRDPGQILHIELGPRAELRMPGGTDLNEVFNFDLQDGDEVVIRGGILNGNRHNKTGTPRVRPYLIRASVPTGARLDIEGMGYKAFEIGMRLDNFGGEVNWSRNRFKDQGQHRGGVGQLTCLLYMVSGERYAANAQLHTNWNTAWFLDALDQDGSAPGGFFVDSGDKSVWPAEENPFVNWWAIGNYLFRYGQSLGNNEIACFHSYPTVGKAFHLFNLIEQCMVAAFNIKGGSDYINAFSQIYTDIVSSKAVPQAGLIHYAPGFHADVAQNHRAKISHAHIVSTAGTATTGTNGISIEGANNEYPEGSGNFTLSPARDVDVDHCTVEVRGIPLYMNYVETASTDRNRFRTLPGPSAIKRGVLIANSTGKITMHNDEIDAEQIAIHCASSSPTLRLIIDGVDAQSGSGFATIDVRGVAELDIRGGTSVRRVGGGAAITVAQDASGNPVGVFRFDRTTRFREGTPNFIWAQILEFIGDEPLTSVLSAVANTAAGTGRSVTIDGDGESGRITLTTGNASLGVGPLVTVTFGVARRKVPRVAVTAGNAAAAAVTGRVYRGSSTTAFTISAATALDPSTQYEWDYRIN